MNDDVTVHVRRRVDNVFLDYVRACEEDELDGIIAEEQNKPGRLLGLVVSPSQN